MAEPIAQRASASEKMIHPPVDRELFSLHPEEQMTERPSHRLQATYLERALSRLLPGWYVAANMGVYWVPGELEYPSVGPDVLVARGRPPREDPAVYLTYEDGPLTLVAEIASPRTRRTERRKRDTDYAIELAVPWYLWIDLPRQELELHQLVEGRYEPVRQEADGSVWCPELGVGFAWQPDKQLVRVVADGTIVPTDEEERALRLAAEQQAAREARRAEQAARRAKEEARRAEQEARRAEREAEARRAAEERAEALAAELERLRRMMEKGQGVE